MIFNEMRRHLDLKVTLAQAQHDTDSPPSSSQKPIRCRCCPLGSLFGDCAQSTVGTCEAGGKYSKIVKIENCQSVADFTHPLENVPKLKILPCLPAMLTKLSIQTCPLLMFVSKNELDQHGLRGNIMKTEDLASKLASMWEVNSGFNITEVLVEDYSSLKQLTTQMGDDISQHLQIIESGLEEGGDIYQTKKI